MHLAARAGDDAVAAATERAAAQADPDLTAGGTVRVDTPVDLQFDATAAPPGDAFTWTIVSEPRTLELRATLHLEDQPLPECVAHVERR